MVYKDGNLYDGKWYWDLKDGSGKMKYANGDMFEGFWSDDKKWRGQMIYSNGDKEKWEEGVAVDKNYYFTNDL